MLAGGADERAGSGGDDEHGEVRSVASQPEHGRLGVLGMAGQVHEGDDFGRLRADLLVRLRSLMRLKRRRRWKRLARRETRRASHLRTR